MTETVFTYGAPSLKFGSGASGELAHDLAGLGASRVLLTRISARGYHSGQWSLPGGGVDHGERPTDALVREVREECGVSCEVGALLDVVDDHFSGVSPSGRFEDFHSVMLLFAAEVPAGAEPRLTETDGTTDAVGWVALDDIRSGAVPTYATMRLALEGLG